MAQSRMTSVRERARADMTEQILQMAREHLAVDGPNLSLRAVARDLGVVSSAVYRYFSSRDELLTALVIEADDSLGEAAEEAVSQIPRRDLHGRWMALGRGIREWALERPYEYALLYGSAVPGYAAPDDTIEPATRTVLVLASLLRDGVDRGALVAAGDRLPRQLRDDLEQVGLMPGFDGIPAAVLARALTAWAALFGVLSFEVFGRLANTITDYDSYFDHQLKAMSRYLELA